jgi:23S rRNA pseudoU1915 N3-methylase RlmH
MARAPGQAKTARKKAGGAPEKVRIVCVSDEERDVLLQEAADYLARTGTRWGASLQLVKPARRGKGADDGKVRSEEAERLLAASEGCHRVAMDVSGKALSSERLS